VLREFSRRTTEALRDALPGPLRAALPVLAPFLAQNVAKEVRKDTQVIVRAAEALAAGAPPGPDVARSLLADARAVDRAFLAGLGDFPARIEIAYPRIEPVRLKRMELGLATAYRALGAWRSHRRLRDEFRPGEYRDILRALLRLYTEETLALSESVRLPALLQPIRRRLADRVAKAMLDAAASLAREAPAAEQKG
jgi:hypothetical protein